MASLLAAPGCTISAQQLEFAKAEKAAEKKDFKAAIGHYKNVADRYVKSDLALKAAQEAGRISFYELKDFKQAVGFYKHVVLYSPGPETRVEAQKQIAELYFNHILDYAQAILEYNRLLELPHSKAEGYQYRMNVAKGYFYLSNFYQSQVEIDTLLKQDYDKPLFFDALLLKANIFITTKQLEEAINVLTEIIQKYPERAKAENIALILAVSYEEQKNFAKAIETLESIKDSYPRRKFIEDRIKTLRERQTYLPGAKGFRK